MYKNHSIVLNSIIADSQSNMNLMNVYNQRGQSVME